MRGTQEKERTLYRDLIRSAWQISWKRRELWILGLFAALLMMNGGALEFIVRACAKIASGSPYDGAISYARSISTTVAAADGLTRASLFIALLIGAAIFAAFLVMATASGGAILKATGRLAAKKNLGARAALAAGFSKIGPLLITQVIGRFIIFTTFVLAALGVYISAGNGWNDLLAIALFVVFAITALVVSFLMMMTDAGIMIGEEKWIKACHNACRFFGRHWLISIEMIGLVFLIAVATAVAAIAAALVLLVPFTLVLLAISSLHAVAGLSVVAVVYEIILFAAILIIGAVLAVFERAAWGLLYVRLADRGAIPKLERLWRLAHSKIHGRNHTR